MKKIKYIFIMILIFNAISCSKKGDYSAVRERLQELKKTQNADIDTLQKNAKEFDEITSIMLTAFEGNFLLSRQLGIKFLQKEMYDLAIEYLSKALAIKPEDVDANYYLGVAYAYKGKYDKSFSFKAEDLFKKALSFQPDNSIIMYSLSILYYYQLDKKNEAIELMKKSVERAGATEYKPAAMLGKYYYNSGEYFEAINYIKEALNKTTSKELKAQFSLNLAHIYSKVNDAANSDLYKKQAKSFNPKIDIEKSMQNFE
ncbi:MAG TPA: tetratricopeptide repeat protein [bacterium]|nr:tetratricopeptide repeat protein [bacterium]